MQSERTVWAEGMGLSDEETEALTAIAEEADRRGLSVDLDPRDVWQGWPRALEHVDADDLAERVREIEQRRTAPAVSGPIGTYAVNHAAERWAQAQGAAATIVEQHLGRAGARVSYDDAARVGIADDPVRAGQVEKEIDALLSARGLSLGYDSDGWYVDAREPEPEDEIAEDEMDA